MSEYYKVQRYTRRNGKLGWVDFVGSECATVEFAESFADSMVQRMTHPTIPSDWVRTVPPMRIVKVQQETVKELAYATTR